MAGGVAQDIGPEFKPQYHKKKGTLHQTVEKKSMENGNAN
jgi:hypothetical protein